MHADYAEFGGVCGPVVLWVGLGASITEDGAVDFGAGPEGDRARERALELIERAREGLPSDPPPSGHDILWRAMLLKADEQLEAMEASGTGRPDRALLDNATRAWVKEQLGEG